MSVFNRQTRVLKRPDKEYFELWMELGTLEKVSQHLANVGEINPKYKQPLSQMTIRIAALRYVIENPDEVRHIYEKEANRTLTQQEWEEYLVRTAMSVYDTSTAKLQDWIQRKGMQKYDYLYSKRFPEGFVV